jgi:hypothetical protein
MTALSRRDFLATAMGALIAPAPLSAQTMLSSTQSFADSLDHYLHSFLTSNKGRALQVYLLAAQDRVRSKYDSFPPDVQQDYHDIQDLLKVMHAFQERRYAGYSADDRLYLGQCLLGNLANGLDYVRTYFILEGDPATAKTLQPKRDEMVAYYRQLDKLHPLNGQAKCRGLYAHLTR